MALVMNYFSAVLFYFIKGISSRDFFYQIYWICKNVFHYAWLQWNERYVCDIDKEFEKENFDKNKRAFYVFDSRFISMDRE